MNPALSTSMERACGVRAGSLFALAAALMGVGLVMVASASAPMGQALFEAPLWRSVHGRQAIFMAAGFLVMLAGASGGVLMLSRPVWRRRAPLVFFAVCVFFLIVVLFPGVQELRGSQRWLRIGPAAWGLGFQPSELAKVGLVVALASLLSEWGKETRAFWRGFVPAALLVSLTVALVGKEDFGTSLIVAAVGGTMLLVGGCRILHLALMGSMGACGMSLLLLMEPYRMERLAAYRNIWENAQGSGYQPVQSLTAIASGGWLGSGLGSGIQKFGYLPEGHTDFIFSVICEETGVLGGGLVIGLYIGLLWLGLRLMLAARTPFERLTAFGLSATVGFQAILNIGVVTVLTPTTGVSLPFISAGGSGLLIFCLMIGIMMAIARRCTDEPGASGSLEDRAISFVHSRGG